jgi:hypothetical protein
MINFITNFINKNIGHGGIAEEIKKIKRTDLEQRP